MTIYVNLGACSITWHNISYMIICSPNYVHYSTSNCYKINTMEHWEFPLNLRFVWLLAGTWRNKRSNALRLRLTVARTSDNTDHGSRFTFIHPKYVSNYCTSGVIRAQVDPHLDRNVNCELPSFVEKEAVKRYLVFDRKAPEARDIHYSFPWYRCWCFHKKYLCVRDPLKSKHLHTN